MTQAAIYRYRNQAAQDLTDTQQVELSYSLALNANPWLAQAPETLAQLATSGMDPETLVTQAGAMAGMANLDEMQQALGQLTPSGQRSLYGKLTEQQQRGLAQMGFNPPGDPADPGFIGGILGSAATVAAPVFGVVSAPVRALAGVPVPGTDTNLFSGALNVMSWIGDVPGHMYRTIRQMEGWQQWVALGVGVAAAAALPFAAPALLAAAAGMGTLATVGTVAGVGLAAGFASTAATSMMVTSPTEWWDIANPFGTRGVMRGERIFSEESKAKTRQLLGGVPHIDAMARDIAANLDVYDLVEDFAENRDATNVNVMTGAIEKVAATMADPGTQEFEAVFAGLSVLVEQPEFREAIDTLQSGKISFGRDVAGMVGLQRGDFGHGLVSGAADALMVLAVDPFLMLGHIGKINRIGRHGIPIPDGDDALNRLSEMIQRDDRLGATVDQVMGAVTNNDFRSMPKAWRPMFDDMADWNRGKAASGGRFETREDFVEWIVDGTKMKKLLEGKATIAGQERLIFNTTNRSVGMGRLSNMLRQVGAGLDDASLRTLMRDGAKRLGIEDELEVITPSMWEDLPVESAWSKIDPERRGDEIRESLSYKTGKVVGDAMVRVPGGASALALIGNVTTMIPPGKAIALVGEGSEEDIVRFVQTFGRHFNMPSYARDEWLNTIMHQGTVSQRRAAVNSFMDSGFTAAGMRTSDMLSQQVDAILGKFDQAYALGGYDSMPMRTLDNMSVGDAAGLLEYQKTISRTVGILPVQHQAVHMVVPSLREMSQMVYNGRILKKVARITDSDLASQAMARYIKPGWLLRIGFIPRAAGEEALAWMLRISEGGIMQEFGARSIGARQAYRDARAALNSVGRKNMTPEQLKALDYQVASHLRPLANMMRRNGSLLPDDHMLVRWSDMMRDNLERGFDRTWATESTELMALRSTDIRNLPRAGQVRRAQLEMRDAVLFGKEHSIRRMLLNGVDPDLSNAAALWVMRHSDAVMKSTSSMNSSLFERDVINPDKEIQHIPNARELGQPENRLVMVTGERTRIRANDIYFDTATHHQIGQPFADDLIGPIITEEYLKYFPAEEMGFYGPAQMLEAVEAMRNVNSQSGQRLVDELLQYRDDNVAAAIEVLREIGDDTGNRVVEMVAIAANRAYTRGAFNIDGLLEELVRVDLQYKHMPEFAVVEDLGTGLVTEGVMVPHTRHIQEDLETMRPIIEGLDALTPNQRAFATAQLTLDSKREGGFFDLAALRRHIAGDNVIYNEPRLKLYRGIKDRTTIEVLPDGTLRMKAVNHREWGDSPNISTSIEWEHAMSYAINPSSFSGHSQRGYGALIEFDGEYAIEKMGGTWDDVVANPIQYSNADASRGRGAYLIGAGSVDETEVALFMGERPTSFPWTDEERALAQRLAPIIDTEDRRKLIGLQEKIDDIEYRYEYGHELDVEDEGYDATMLGLRELRAESAELAAKIHSDPAVIQEVSDFLATRDPHGTPMTRTFTRALDALQGNGSVGDNRVLVSELRSALNVDTFEDYIDIPAGKWKIHDSASMKHLQEKSLGSTSRFAPRIHDAQFETVWGQPLDEYWTATIGELDAALDQLTFDQARNSIMDFTFVSIRNKTGAEAGALMAAGENPVDQRLIDWVTSPTGDPDYPTQWDALTAEAEAAGEQDHRFWANLDDYVATKGKVEGQYNNRWAGLRDSYSLRGTGEMPAEQLEQIGVGWSPFYENAEDLKQGLQYRVAQELMRPENQQYTKLSDQVTSLNDGTAVAKPIAGGLARLYTPVVPQNVNPDIAKVLEQDLVEQMSQVSDEAAEGVMTMLASVHNDPFTFMQGLNRLRQDYTAQGMDTFIRKWNPNMPVTPEAIEKFTGEARELVESVLTTFTHMAAERLVRTQDLRRVNDPIIQAMSIDQRADLLQDALMELLVGGMPQVPVARPLTGLAYSDPRYARYITNSLSDVPFDDSVKHMAIGIVDVPRQSVIGNVDQRIEGVRPRTGAGKIEGTWKLDNQYGPKTEISDGSHLVEQTDGTLAPGAAWEQAVSQWAERIVEATWSSHTRGFRETSKLKPANQRNGMGVGRRSGDRVIPVRDGEEFTVAEDLYVLNGDGGVDRPLDALTNEFFERIGHEGNDELMWNILGPMIRDREEQAAGFTRIVPRTLENKRPLLNRMKPTLQVDQAAEVEQFKVLTRSRVDDIDLEPATALPNMQIAAEYKNLPNNMWDRFVRWGFDSVIGPSVDALVRKPMSFHYFAGAYKQNKQYLAWMLDDRLFKTEVPNTFGQFIKGLVDETHLDDDELAAVAVMARQVYGEGIIDGDQDAAMRFLASISDSDHSYHVKLNEAATTLEGRAHSAAGDAMRAKYGDDWDQHPAYDFQQWDDLYTADPRVAQAHILRAQVNLKTSRRKLHWQLPEHGMTDNAAERFVAAYNNEVPPEMWSQPNDVIAAFLKKNSPHLPNHFNDKEWGVLRAARQNLAVTLTDLNDIATLRAINNITPFLDSHEQRSMFAEYGRNFIPFWYAEENFLKRWGRTLAMDGLSGGLAAVRKAQLMYAGIKTGGVIRTDVNGKDWFVYPGSGLLQEVIDKVWVGKESLPIGVLMQASTDSLLPGINDQFGQASFSPLVAVPLNATLMMFPETQDLRRSVMGDVAINRSIIKQFVPGIATNVWDAMFADEDSSTKYSSAMMTAIAFAEANGEGLPEAATAVQADEYLDKIRNHTRIILLTQAITGYFVPGAPSAVATNEDMGSFGWLTGIGVDDPRQITTDLYRSYVSNLGVDEGTAAFLKAFPQADLEDVVSPMAFTTSASTSVSGAPLPATGVGLEWYNANNNWVDGMPEAGAWFLPPDESDAEFDYYAYSQQLASGLRKQKSPEEFLRSIKYRQGADIYFANKDLVDAALLKVGGDAAAAKEINSRWSIWKSEFVAAHPIFGEELQSGASRERRARTIAQMRDAVNDPMAPPSPHTEGIKQLVEAYDMFTAARKTYSLRRDESSRRKLAKLKQVFGAWVTDWQLRNPQLERLWSSVYEPEARLD